MNIFCVNATIRPDIHGMKIEAATCTACHNDKSPTMDASKPFDFEKQKVEGSHENFPLKQREG